MCIHSIGIYKTDLEVFKVLRLALRLGQGILRIVIVVVVLIILGCP